MDSHWSLNPSNNPLSFVENSPHYNNHHHHQQQPHIHSKPSETDAGNLLQQQLRGFWENQQQESRQAVDFRNHSLPLARIKKIMKSDDNVRMISADAPVLLSRACEIFIQDLTLRAWNCTEEGKRKTLQKADISSALSTTDLFDFLVDILPREKPIISNITPMNPSSISALGLICDNNQLQPGYSVGEGAGLTMGLQNYHLIHGDDQVDNSNNKYNNINEGWPNYLSHHHSASVWTPPDM